jgi:sugar phosphate permease
MISWILCLSYGVFALFRKAVSTALPWMIQDLKLEKNHIGLISSAFATGYGFSKFFGSLACDYFKAKSVLIIGLVVAAFASIIFASLPSLSSMVVCWTLQGVAQGIAWPSISFIICTNFDLSNRGTIWSVVSSVYC